MKIKLGNLQQKQYMATPDKFLDPPVLNAKLLPAPPHMIYLKNKAPHLWRLKSRFLNGHKIGFKFKIIAGMHIFLFFFFSSLFEKGSS